MSPSWTGFGLDFKSMIVLAEVDINSDSRPGTAPQLEAKRISAL